MAFLGMKFCQIPSAEEERMKESSPPVLTPLNTCIGKDLRPFNYIIYVWYMNVLCIGGLIWFIK